MENPVRNNITNRGIQEVRPKVNKSHPDCYIKQNNAMNSLAEGKISEWKRWRFEGVFDPEINAINPELKITRPSK